MIEKLDMRTKDLTQEKIRMIYELFPNCVTESISTGGISLSIDFDALRQELSDHIVEGPKERYQFTWPDKSKAKLLANTPTTKTLRPCREESVDFDSTKNLYIEGDNLEVLKILRETYLGKVKMIYIDPPYNTGNDFVYDDDFSMSSSEYDKISGEYNGDNQRLVLNNPSNGRFHTDWLNMMYPRLKLAKELLTEDGAIFISIDENEADKLKHICDEIFGENNYRNQILVRRRIKSLNVQFAENGLNSFNVGFEYIYVYSKNPSFLFNPLRMKKTDIPEKGTWNVFWSNADRPTMRYDVLGFTPVTGQWRWQKELAEEAVDNYRIYEEQYSSKMSLEDYWTMTGEKLRFIRRIKDGVGKNGGVQYWVPPRETSLRTSNWTDVEVSQIAKEYDIPFENPKNVNLVKTIISSVPGTDFTILDFFSGTSTTADAVMRINSEDGGERNFIMVQLPEKIKESSNAYESGYRKISDLGKERIRQAGIKVKANIEAIGLDVGFRVFKLDDSNMKDVFYSPDNAKRATLDDFVSNIKEGRSHEDLLFQVMLEHPPLDLSSKIDVENIGDNMVFSVDDGYLVACFDESLSEDVVTSIAKRDIKSAYVVFRDSSMKDDMLSNIEQIFETYSPNTTVKIL